MVGTVEIGNKIFLLDIYDKQIIVKNSIITKINVSTF